MIELRDSIAIEAMKLILASWQDEGVYAGNSNNAEVIATLSYSMADEMIKARSANDLVRPSDFYALGITVRSMNVLNSNGIDTIDKLLQCRANDLLKLPLAGRKVLGDIITCLSRFNLNLAY